MNTVNTAEKLNPMTKWPQSFKGQNQTGAVLAVSLIILLLLTIIGVAGMQTTTMEERMAGNMRDVNVAFQAAEASLREAENFLTAATLPSFDGTNGLYQPAALTNEPLWKTVNWNSTTAVISYGGSMPDVSSAPKYIIEELSTNFKSSGGSLAADEPSNPSKFYRITSRAVGASETTVVVLVSVYRR